MVVQRKRTTTRTLQTLSPLKEKEMLIVHLGNADELFYAQKGKSNAYAERFSSCRFIGIDYREPVGETPENYRHIREGFAQGLRQLEDGSVSVISSELGLGMYDGRGRNYLNRDSVEDPGRFKGFADRDSTLSYTKETLGVVHDKLKDGGRLHFSVSGPALDVVEEAMASSPFEQAKIAIRPFRKNEYGRMAWTRHFRDAGVPVFQVTAEK